MANTKKVTVEVSEALHKKAARAAKKKGTTISTIVREALKAASK